MDFVHKLMLLERTSRLAFALLADPKPRWGTFAACLISFAAPFAVNALLHTYLLHRFLQTAPRLDERGLSNPSILAFMRDLMGIMGQPGVHIPAGTANLLFVAAVVTIVVLSTRARLPYRAQAEHFNMREVVYFLCFVVALISPRLKTYSYILVLLPTLVLLRKHPKNLIPLVAFCVFSITNDTLPLRDVMRLIIS